VFFSRRREGTALRRLAPWLALAAILLGQVSCTHHPAAPARLAVLRFENLGGAAGDDWIGRAFEEILDAELAGVPELYAIPSAKLLAMDRALGSRPVAAPGISAGLAAALSAGATRIGYGNYTMRNGRLEARLSLADPRTGKIAATFAAGGDVFATATALARQISPHTSGYATRSETALHAYIDALEAATEVGAVSRAEAALQADPGFGPAARLLAGRRVHHDPSSALDCLEQALAHASGMPASERAQLRLDIASMENQALTARQEALAAIAAAEPANAEAWFELGNAAFARRDYDAAQAAFRKAAELDPTQVGALNQGAYAAAFGGHLDEAVQSLRRYQSLRPSDLNSLDSLGDVQLLTGHPREAEAFYVQAAKRDPHFQNGGDWLKAAMARLMTGDVTGADALARCYFDARAAEKDPVLPYRQAEWSWASGRRREGFARMAEFAQGAASGPLHELSARAHAQLAIWDLVMGDRAHAAQLAETAAAEAGAASAAIAAVARFLAQQPATPAEWAARTDREFAQPQQAAVRDFSLAYALLLQKDFAAAAPVLKKIYDSGDQADGEGLPVLLAWTYLETGRTSEAAALVRDNPVPSISGTGPFLSFYFPRIYYLRAEIARRQSRAAEAAPQFRLFRTLSGPDSLIWGEESAAR